MQNPDIRYRSTEEYPIIIAGTRCQAKGNKLSVYRAPVYPDTMSAFLISHSLETQGKQQDSSRQDQKLESQRGQVIRAFQLDQGPMFSDLFSH